MMKLNNKIHKMEFVSQLRARNTKNATILFTV